MKIVLFYHSLLSDWNHGNAHFLRGVASELLARGHDAQVYEPHDSWSLQNLLKEHGQSAVESFHAAYSTLSSTQYDLANIDLDACSPAPTWLWCTSVSDHALAAHRRTPRANKHYRLLFHDTHQKSRRNRTRKHGPRTTCATTTAVGVWHVIATCNLSARLERSAPDVHESSRYARVPPHRKRTTTVTSGGWATGAKKSARANWSRVSFAYRSKHWC
jgi:hypothetical protein